LPGPPRRKAIRQAQCKFWGQSPCAEARIGAGELFLRACFEGRGQVEEAIARLQSVLEQYPRDRVVRNELGRIYFLQKRYADAVNEFQATLAIDPEDLQAHYNLMLCYNGLGNDKRAEEHKVRYLRYKADESAQALTGPYRQAHPEDNNERQLIHEHVSGTLAEAPSAVGKKKAKRAAAKNSIVKSAAAGGGR